MHPKDGSSDDSVNEQKQGVEEGQEDDIEYQHAINECTRTALRDNNVTKVDSSNFLSKYEEKSVSPHYYDDLSPRTRELPDTIEYEKSSAGLDEVL